MSRAAVLAPGAEFAAGRPYLERAEEEPRWHDRLASALYRSTIGPVRQAWDNSRLRRERIVEATDAHDAALRPLSDEELQRRARALRPRLRSQGFTLALAAESFAIVREAAARTTGRRHFESQLMGGYGLLQGKLVEMATGEGKTFSATLPACTVALAGFPVHVITVNDYLAARDAEEMAPLYHYLGLSVGTVVQGMKKPERRAAYACDITYCTNKEIAFDYLRDRVAVEGRSSGLHRALEQLRGERTSEVGLVLRGLYYAIVDEADSVFIDEARTPLILSSSGEAADEAMNYQLALDFVAQLDADEDYVHDPFQRSVALTEEGRHRLDEFAGPLGQSGSLWGNEREREELVRQALSAVLLYERDLHYVVAEGKVQIVDESTGRVMPDRSWERGLHQLIEAKEGCALTERRTTLARLTYQRLFCRYVRLSGMTGTGTEVAREIEAVYGPSVARVPLHRPSKRRHGPATVHLTAAQKWQQVVDTVEQLALREGRPVLIGTRSVRSSEEISALLSQRGIEHALLNAKQDKIEADIVAQAGQAGRVTVATNMAGRGTDIRLGPGVAEKGGLHVILTEYHESRRIDRQLFGRCARQGDPGSCEAVVSLEDEIYRVCAPAATAWVEQAMRRGVALPAWVLHGLKALAQYSAEARNTYVRVQNLKLDRHLNRVLAFSGRGE
jgi:preprotein translocase subunit SecA